MPTPAATSPETESQAASTPPVHDITVGDVEYLRHADNGGNGEKPLLARIYRPSAPGNYPMMIDLHGGAWVNGDRGNDKVLCEALAGSGVVVAAVDFRQPPDAGYPGAMADINFAIRWLKANAGRFGGDAASVGIFGISSGGHQAMLAAMRPADPRYAAITRPEVPQGLDASVACVVLCWPVIDPLGRYHYAKARVAAADGYPKQLPAVIPNHDAFWQTEDAMSEASPVLMLERGEKVAMPPVLYVQGAADEMHPRADLDRFVTAYLSEGGSVDLALYDGEVEGFVTRGSKSLENQRAATARIIAFVHANLAGARSGAAPSGHSPL